MEGFNRFGLGRPWMAAPLLSALLAAGAGCGSSKPSAEQTAATLPTAGTVSLTGTPVVGATLTAVPAGFSTGTPAGSYHYVWQRCAEAACASAVDVGADAPDYTMVAADVDGWLRAGVSVSNSCTSGCGASATAWSAAAAVQGTSPTAGTVSLTGTPVVGATLTAVPAGFSMGTPAGSYHYVWQRCSDAACASAVDVGADAPDYLLAAADAGAYVRAGVLASNACGAGCGASATAWSSVATVPGVCGNGVREAGEQCDDGNVTNLDGCDQLCRFEQVHRINWLQLQFATDAFCTANAFGGAIVNGAAQGTIQSWIDTGISDGTVSNVLQFLQLDDLTGTSDSSVRLGVVNGAPVIPGDSPYSGTSDLDWWYTAGAALIDGNRDPVNAFDGSIAAKVLTAGPGRIPFSPFPGLQLTLAHAMITGTIGATSAPLLSAGLSPGHLASEHLDPALVSFGTMGAKNASGAARACARLPAADLALATIPSSLLSLCTSYAADNTMLDLLVGGCTYIAVIQVVRATQPDTVDPDVPAVGAGGPYVLSAGANKRVNACRDRNNAVVDFNACLASAAYTGFLKFATGRVIAK